MMVSYGVFGWVNLIGEYIDYNLGFVLLIVLLWCIVVMFIFEYIGVIIVCSDCVDGLVWILFDIMLG